MTGLPPETLEKIKAQLIRISIAYPNQFDDLITRARTNHKEREIIKMIGHLGTMGSHQYSVAKGMSIQHASTTLVGMYKKGLLVRTRKVASSGGIEYEFGLSAAVKRAVHP